MVITKRRWVVIMLACIAAISVALYFNSRGLALGNKVIVRVDWTREWKMAQPVKSGKQLVGGWSQSFANDCKPDSTQEYYYGFGDGGGLSESITTKDGWSVGVATNYKVERSMLFIGINPPGFTGKGNWDKGQEIRLYGKLLIMKADDGFRCFARTDS
jgi:hypothetical protein